MKKLALVMLFSALCGLESRAAPSVILPPAVPQRSQSGDLVGFVLHNPGTVASPPEEITFGQVFAQGAVAATSILYARDQDTNRDAQMDVLATHPDGSVRFAAITTWAPGIPAGGSLSGMLAVKGGTRPAPVDLAALAPRLTVTLTVANSPLGAFTRTIDLGAALEASLASKQPDYWLHGSLTTQARVDVVVGASLHVTADVTGYEGGEIRADVQFNNDLAMGNSGGPFSYTAAVVLNGKAVSFPKIVQDQYQDWHALVVGSGSPQTIVVQHDIAYLESSGAILPYDLTTGVAAGTLQGYAALAQSPGFGAPLAANGVTQYMPTTGGRADVGYTTQYDTVWLLTQDQRAATIGLAQGDAGGAVPWNMRLASGRWLTPQDYPDIWATYGRTYVVDLTQPSTNTAWSPDTAHQPDLAYVPYLMRASRWYLDRLNAQAAWSMTASWPGYRCLRAQACTAANDWHVIDLMSQVRSQAWSTREIVEAGWIGRSGTFESAYFAQVAAENWSWLASQAAGLSASQGQAAGWVSGDYGSAGVTAPWQQDYLTGIVVLASRMGDVNARKVLAWNANWVAQRFVGPGMNPHDGCTYNLTVTNGANSVPYTTWSTIESKTVAAGQSNGTGWKQSNGDYCALARAALGGLLAIEPADAAARQALTWLQGSGAPYIDKAYFQSDPTWNVVP